MADNIDVSPGTTGTPVPVRCLSDGTNEWPAGVVAYPTTILAGANVLQIVDAAHGLPVAVVGTVPVSGTLSAVSAATISGSLPAGTAILGKFSTDQTTHGTTDLVAADITKVGGNGIALGATVKGSGWPIAFPTDQAASIGGTVSVSGIAGGTVSALAAATITGALPTGANTIGAVTSNPSTGTLTDHSGTIAAGGTAQQVMAVNASRKIMIIQNVSTSNLWINWTTTAVQAQPSYLLAPNASLVLSRYVSTELLSIIGATTGQAFTAKEG